VKFCTSAPSSLRRSGPTGRRQLSFTTISSKTTFRSQRPPRHHYDDPAPPDAQVPLRCPRRAQTLPFAFSVGRPHLAGRCPCRCRPGGCRQYDRQRCGATTAQTAAVSERRRRSTARKKQVCCGAEFGPGRAIDKHSCVRDSDGATCGRFSKDWSSPPPLTRAEARCSQF
jgi:hypothetical protein